MAQLISPGVDVQVIDESFYTPSAPGTVPMIFVVTAQDKANSAGTGTALATRKSEAGKVKLVTAQRELAELYGDPIFKTGTNNNPVHAGELNEYGLQAAYSYLGIASAAYVVRADVNLAELDPSASEPVNTPPSGTYWFDTSASTFGIFEWDNIGKIFTNQVPLVITEESQLVDLVNFVPKSSVGTIGSYAIVAITEVVGNVLFYKNQSNVWVKVGTQDWNDSWAGSPALAISKHTQVPQWKNNNPAAVTGSVWIKITSANAGANYKVKKFNDTSKLWETIPAPLFLKQEEAIYGLDQNNGGGSIAVGSLYVHVFQKTATSPVYFVIKRRSKTKPTQIRTGVISAATSTALYTYTISETERGNDDLHEPTPGAVQISIANGDTAVQVADKIAAAINAENFTHLSAAVDSQNRVVFTHDVGGDFIIKPLNNASYTFLNNSMGLDEDSDYFFFENYDDNTDGYRASNWEILSKVASPNEVTSLAADGRLWYNSVMDEVDIMVHNGVTWVGYRFPGSAAPNAIAASPYINTDPDGPQVRATEPKLQSDGTALVEGDLWIDSSDTENYPQLYKWNGTSQEWVLVDLTDQTTEDGILFADARYGTTGGTIDTAPDSTIAELLVSAYLDPDAPDPDLYPQGMLLFNTRKSGFNVKKFVRNHIDTNAINIRFKNEVMSTYFPHRWKTESANKENGAGNFGRLAQRKVVVQALQALVNSNNDIRDDATRVFNLMACPGYPELIGEMISLNYDRGLTAFIVGDAPFRLTPDATSLNEWATNVNLAVQDSDQGLTSRDEYLGVFYPSGFTSDNFGQDVVVPPSHMMLRTIALSDQVSYPWFAPAGTRRGGITNASSVGYVTAEGEFEPIALNEGQRDTLYTSNVNPITVITGAGIVNYGQKTRARNASALDRINVARLVIYLRGQLNRLAKPYVFEPNDKITRDEIKQAAESLLLELVGQRALYDYIVVCDESNNFPARVDRNELYLDIAIEPVKAVEFIYIPLRLKNTGEIAGL